MSNNPDQPNQPNQPFNPRGVRDVYNFIMQEYKGKRLRKDWRIPEGQKIQRSSVQPSVATDNSSVQQPQQHQRQTQPRNQEQPLSMQPTITNEKSQPQQSRQHLPQNKPNDQQPPEKKMTQIKLQVEQVQRSTNLSNFASQSDKSQSHTVGTQQQAPVPPSTSIQIIQGPSFEVKGSSQTNKGYLNPSQDSSQSSWYTQEQPRLSSFQRDVEKIRNNVFSPKINFNQQKGEITATKLPQSTNTKDRQTSKNQSFIFLATAQQNTSKGQNAPTNLHPNISPKLNFGVGQPLEKPDQTSRTSQNSGGLFGLKLPVQQSTVGVPSFGGFGSIQKTTTQYSPTLPTFHHQTAQNQPPKNDQSNIFKKMNPNNNIFTFNQNPVQNTSTGQSLLTKREEKPVQTQNIEQTQQLSSPQNLNQIFGMNVTQQKVNPNNTSGNIFERANDFGNNMVSTNLFKKPNDQRNQTQNSQPFQSILPQQNTGLFSKPNQKIFATANIFRGNKPNIFCEPSQQTTVNHLVAAQNRGAALFQKKEVDSGEQDNVQDGQDDEKEGQKQESEEQKPKQMKYTEYNKTQVICKSISPKLKLMIEGKLYQNFIISLEKIQGSPFPEIIIRSPTKIAMYRGLLNQNSSIKVTQTDNKVSLITIQKIIQFYLGTQKTKSDVQKTLQNPRIEHWRMTLKDNAEAEKLIAECQKIIKEKKQAMKNK